MGCDWLSWCNRKMCPYFNPRTHVGCDQVEQGHNHGLRISIHAPTWGATTGKRRPDFLHRFQSTHPRGVRRVPDGHRVHTFQFQSTHPRGVRQYLKSIGAVHTQFQSTHPRGVRLMNFGSRHVDFLFQSTHPRGVRRSPDR